MGCSGGSREIAILYVIDKNGIDTEYSYPYNEYVRMSFLHTVSTLNISFVQQYMCRFKESTVGGRATGMVRIQSHSETDLKAAVAIAGPVTVGVDHMHSSFQVKKQSQLICLYSVCSFTAVGYLMNHLAPTTHSRIQC